MKKRCAVFIFNGFIEQDVGPCLTKLNDTTDFLVETFSTHGQMVTSKSGLRVMPHASLDYIEPEDFDLLLLPSGDLWEKGDNLDIFPLIKATVNRRRIAAIGSATLALADLGLLDDIPHTSNFPGYLQQFCPDYHGQGFYRYSPFVTAGDIITLNLFSFKQMLVPTLQEI